MGWLLEERGQVSEKNSVGRAKTGHKSSKDPVHSSLIGRIQNE